jgi:Contractile injection system tube protein/LysM domain
VALTKAMIQVIPQEHQPRGWPGRAIEVQFNPSEYTLTKGAQIAEIGIPGIDSPVLQFIRGQNEKLTLDLFFDTTRSGMGESPVVDVRTMTDRVYQLVKIQPETHAPPRVRFTWGQGLSFQAIVESIQRKFTVFNPAGIPLRATLTVTFREYKTLEEQLKEMNLRSADQSKQRVVRRGDTLSGLAFQEYRHPGAWRVIADNNRDVIRNPRRLEPGTVLVVPPLERGAPVVGG